MTKVDLKQFARSGAIHQDVIRYNDATGLWEPGVAPLTGGGGAPTAEDKNLIPFATAPADGQDTGINITLQPIGDRYVTVIVNGISSSIGDADLGEDCYFSNDGGLSSLPLDQIVPGVRLYWNSLIAGFQLAPTDIVDLDYDILDGYDGYGPGPGPGPGSGGGWTDDGLVVRLTTITDFVGVGTVTPNVKFDVIGDVGASNSIVLGPLGTAATTGAVRLQTAGWIRSTTGITDVGLLGYDGVGTAVTLGDTNIPTMPAWAVTASTNGLVVGDNTIPFMAASPAFAGTSGIYVNLDQIHFEETIATPLITQDTTNAVGRARPLEIQAQTNIGGAGIGGNLILQPGDGALIDGGIEIGFNHNITNNAEMGVCIGRNAEADNYGEIAQSNGIWVDEGESQSSMLVLRNWSSGAVTVDLFLDGTGEYFTLDELSTYLFEVKVVARAFSPFASHLSAAYKFELCGERTPVATQIVGLVSKTVVAEDNPNWDCDIDIDDTGADELNIQCTGDVGNDIVWTAFVRATKVKVPPS